MILLFCALLLAQENVTLVVRPREKPGIFEKLARAGRRLFEKEEPQAAQGNALEAEHKHEEALRQYDQVTPRLPEGSTAQAELQLDRASALLGFASPEKAPEAASAAAQALRQGTPAVRAQGAYDLALALEQMGKADEALKMYQETLKLDPDDADAKVNLELLLRTEEEKKQQQKMSGDPRENKQPQDQKDQEKKRQEESAQEQKKNDQQDPGKKEERRQDQKQDPSQPQPQAGQEQEAQKDGKEQQEKPSQPVDRSEAERLLDALRAGEKNLQAWRFAKEKRKEARRGNETKDW